MRTATAFHSMILDLIATNGLFWESSFFDVAKAIEETAGQAGLLMMKSLIDEQVQQLAKS